MRAFFLIWLGQLVSIVGSQLTGFALGVWVYQNTGLVTQFSLIALCVSLPAFLISPLAGAWVDRWDLRWTMIVSDCLSGISTLVILLLLLTDHLEIWHIYLVNIIGSVASAFQVPAYNAAVTLLVPPQHLTQANGMRQLDIAFSQLIAPPLAGILLETIRLQGVIFIDLATFFVALFSLLVVAFPRVNIKVNASGESSIFTEIIEGWNYLVNRPGLLGLLILLANVNALSGSVIILFTPLILSLTTAKILGLIQFFGGLGMLAGSLVLTIWGGSQVSLVNTIFRFSFLGGLVIFIAGTKASLLLFGLCSFLFLFGLPIIQGLSQVIFQKKVPINLQGRVFALNRMISQVSFPLAYMIAGILADNIFEPMMANHGLLANSLGQIIGVGPGRGIALMFMIMGLLSMLGFLLAYQYPRLRFIEQELPDIALRARQ